MAANRLDVLEYEIAASWWASWIWWGYGQEKSAKYFAWKVGRKYRRYAQLKAVQLEMASEERESNLL